jgi:hypothetical protein
MTRGNILQHPSKLRKIMEEKIQFSGSQSSIHIKTTEKNGFQIQKMQQWKEIFYGKKRYCGNMNGIS